MSVESKVMEEPEATIVYDKDYPMLETGYLKVGDVCPYGGGYRGEHRVGLIDVSVHVRKTYNPIYIFVMQHGERMDQDEMDEDEEGHDSYDNIAHMRLDKDEAIKLWNLLGKAINQAKDIKHDP